jgi:hypothetical protein
MVNFATGPMLTLFKQKDMSKKIILPELSATYCFALLKAKAKEVNFNPKDYLPEECFKEHKNNLVMPYHLNNMLETLNLKLSDTEYLKLWQRFDLNNIGGVKTRVFLRLLDYNRNHLDELSNDADKLRSKTCIVDLTKQSKKSNTNRSSILTNRSAKPVSSIMAGSLSINEETNSNSSNTDTNTNKENSSKVSDVSLDSASSISNITMTNETIPTNSNSTNQTKLTESNFLVDKKKTTNSACKSTLSEAKIKSMVHLLKNTNRFGPNDDLTIFLNNKVICTKQSVLLIKIFIYLILVK